MRSRPHRWRPVQTATAPPGAIRGTRDEIGTWLEEVLAAFPVTQHYITNVEIALDGDHAKVTAVFYNPMRFPGATDMSECGGWSHHEFV